MVVTSLLAEISHAVVYNFLAGQSVVPLAYVAVAALALTRVACGD